MTCPELAVGTRLRTMLGKELRVITELNRSSLWVIYSIYYDERPAVLRWYRPESLHDKARFADYVREKVMRGSPSRQFIWPIDMVKGDGDALGCVIDQMPDGFVGLWRLLQRPSMFPFFRRVVDACLGIVTMFPSLHERGYCFQEVSVDKLFANPETGNVLANVEDEIAPAGMRNYLFGDQRFMAPEIVAERAFPSMQSDLHSMAVLVFMLLCMRHPLEGARLMQGGSLQTNENRSVYGTDPVFVFDPDDSTNRPVPGSSHVPCVWPHLPRHTRDFFCRAFSQDALHNPARRPTEREWLRELAHLRLEVVTCHCGNEVFLEGTEPAYCENCGALCGALLRMEVGGCTSVVANDVRLYRFMLQPACATNSMLDPQLQVVAPKGNPWDVRRMGLRNVSGEPWRARIDGSEVDVAPGMVVRATEGLELEVLGEKVRICANSVATIPNGS